ncbi:MAG: hypothetical protein OXP75_13380 [Rhodospirillales bacterium]|nr:hypothetical protein [Rhodospirillales bacterium]
MPENGSEKFHIDINSLSGRVAAVERELRLYRWFAPILIAVIVALGVLPFGLLSDDMADKASSNHAHSAMASSDHAHDNMASSDHAHSAMASSDHTHDNMADYKHVHREYEALQEQTVVVQSTMLHVVYVMGRLEGASRLLQPYSGGTLADPAKTFPLLTAD